MGKEVSKLDTAQVSQRRGATSAAQRRDFVKGLLFTSPFLLGMLLLWIGPMLYSIFLIFQEWNMMTPPEFVAWKNFSRLFNDKLMLQSLGNTAYYTFLGVPLQLTVAFALAVLLNQDIRGKAFYRTIYYMPSITPAVASAVVWLQILNQEFGVLNQVLGWFGIQPVSWLFNPVYTKPAFILMSLWGVGPQMVIFLAGLQNVPQELMEAAQIDGANAWRRFWSVTIPIISPVVFFNLVVGIIGSFQVFTASFIMTDGGPQDSTLFMVLYIYRNAFEYFRMGYAAILAWLLFWIMYLLKILGQPNHYRTRSSALSM
jgi:multiple sugar transport system permease protein